MFGGSLVTAAIIVGAGRGVRMGGPIPKQYRGLDGLPVLRHTVLAFLRHPGIDRVQVMIHPNDHRLYDAALEGLQLPAPLVGGNTRQETVRLGLESLADAPPEKVIVHDGVRPFVDQETISAVIAALDEAPAVVAALPVPDTLKRAPGGQVVGTVDRSDVWRAQTPQGFRYRAILEAHRAALRRDPMHMELTDDSAVAEAAGLPVRLVHGSDDNFKITTERDLERAELLLSRGRMETHTGWGFDFAPFTPGDHLMLCGIPVPYARTVARNHNTDVPLNAATDALLGTVGGHDGRAHFNAASPIHRGMSSDLFVRQAVSLVAMKGGRIAHVDMTILGEWPDIAPHRANMVLRLADLLSVEPERVGVKRLGALDAGWHGRGDGIGAQCLATVQFPAV
jgi:2-C-methyl-D-erythritol 4-phosphate cytidylyltransferase/2-C-methyl-D-erythritol 2,4-cyclodiphosphate synthase